MIFPVLPPEANRRARRLYRRLLLSYLGVTVTVLGGSAVALYLFVAKSLHQQIQAELIVLAEAAAPSLEIARTDTDLSAEFFSAEAGAEHWHSLEQHSQSLEWYDAQGQLLVREGKIFPDFSVPEATSLDPAGVVQRDRQQQLYVATIPVYEAGQLAGIVRASEAMRIVEVPLRHLRWGMLIGGGLGLGAIFLSGLWLSQLALIPFVQSYQRLRQFTADASHEMRSPLAVIQAALDLMSERSEELPVSSRAHLAKIVTANQYLRGLTEALLKLARTDEISILSLKTLPLHELLQDLVDVLEELATEKEISLIYHELNTVSIRGDNSQLIQLFSNLIENGIKYTPHGGSVTVSLSQRGRQAIVTVSDTGIGISQDDISHVFERFWQAEKSRPRQAGGLGLGLAIARDIAKRHKGDIMVHSQVGKGSKFDVHLPAITK